MENIAQQFAAGGTLIRVLLNRAPHLNSYVSINVIAENNLELRANHTSTL